MLYGSLNARFEQNVLDGANHAAIKHKSGWEIIAFSQAKLVAGEDGQSLYYDLSILLRGIEGTQSEMNAPFGDDAYFVLLDKSKLFALQMAPADIGKNHHWRVGYHQAPYTDMSYAVLEETYHAIHKRPLSPTFLRAFQKENGDIILKWIRRSRDMTRDGFGARDINLGEINEAYEIEIIKNGAVQAAYQSACDEVIYPQADIERDFGAPITQLTFRVYQISSDYGRGKQHRRLSMSQTPFLKIPYIQDKQAKKHITLNEGLNRLDMLVHIAIDEIGRVAPPSPSQDGMAFIIGEQGEGLWADRHNQIAFKRDGWWSYATPQIGWSVWNKQDNRRYVFYDNAWRLETASGA